MNGTHLLRSAGLLALLACAGQADQITLKNGDTLTGTVTKKDGDKITVKSEILGEVTFPWSAVTAVRSDAPLVVVLPDGKEVNGRLATQGDRVEVITPGAPVTTSLAEIAALRDEAEQRKYQRLLAPGWLDLWGGYFDIGLALARGNARTSTLTTAFETARLTRRDKTRLYLNQIRARATVAGFPTLTASAVRGGWAYDHNIATRFFYNVFNDYEHDRFQSLDLRFVAGGGLGVHAIKSERAVLDLVGGVAYNRENFSNQLVRNSGEAYWGDDLTLRLSRITSLTQSFRMFNSLTRTGAYRVNYDISTATALRRWLSIQTTASNRYLSNPVFGRQRNDVLLTTGLRLTFVR